MTATASQPCQHSFACRSAIFSAAARIGLAHSGNEVKIVRTDHLARSHMQEEHRLGTFARAWISFVAVIVNEKLGQPRHEPDQVEAAAIIPVPNLLLGNRVSSFLNSRPHSHDMKLDAAQPYVPDANLKSRRQCQTEKRGDGVTAQRRLKCKIQSLSDCALEKSFPLIPSPAIRFCFGEMRVGVPDSSRCLIGIEVVGAFREEHGAGDAALSCTVGSRQDINTGSDQARLRAAATAAFPNSFGVA